MSNQLLLRRRAMMLGKKNEDNILTFTAVEANSSVKLYATGSAPAVTLEYNLNGGGWLPYTVGDIITLPNAGNKVKMRGYNTVFSNSEGINGFSFNKPVYASGDITSLLNLEGGDIPLSSYCFKSTFFNCYNLLNAPKLPSTMLAEGCYLGMFKECYNLITAPELPAIKLEKKCYQTMFSSCTSLTMAPELPATTLANNCYAYMFWGCNAISSHDIANLNSTSIQMFYGNAACLSLIIRSDTPPTIASSTFTGLKSDCKIYVPYSADHSILDAYKAKQYWSDRAEYIFELDENGEIPE